MSWTTYEGKLEPTNRWEEASKNFSEERVQKFLFDVLSSLKKDGEIGKDNYGTIWIKGSGAWIRIDPQGIIELGEPAA